MLFFKLPLGYVLPQIRLSFKLPLGYVLPQIRLGFCIDFGPPPLKILQNYFLKEVQLELAHRQKIKNRDRIRCQYLGWVTLEGII